MSQSNPAVIRSRHDFEFLWKVFFFYSSSSSSCLTSSFFAAGSSRLKYLPVTYLCDCSVRAEELERGKKSDTFLKYITRRVIQRRLTLSMIGRYLLTLFACGFFFYLSCKDVLLSRNFFLPKIKFLLWNKDYA